MQRKDKTMLVSVIIPAYNHEKYIQKAIKSVISQTYQDIELIVINDGSSDNTHEKIQELIPLCQERFKNFIYINQKNIGLIKTLNKALELINGEYFSMLGSDDYYYDYKTKLQVEFFNKNPDFVLCYGNVTFVDGDDNIKKDGKTKKFKSGYIFDNLLYGCFLELPTVMLKTKVVKLYGFDERFFLEDYPLFLKIAKDYKIGYLKEKPLSYYRLHGLNVSSNLLNMIYEVEKILLDYKNEIQYKKVMSYWYLRWFADLSKTKYKKEAKEYMIKALATNWYKIRFISSVIRYLFK